ncbi:MAG TPA: hypothetical protein VFX05_03335 [Casimicrobiaceae bacterium]|nr:hypothetical protein [Casimicrobiaceae bacterium]
MIPASPTPDGAATPRRRAFSRAFWHALGFVAAGLLAWLVLRAYRDPALMIDLLNWRLC